MPFYSETVWSLYQIYYDILSGCCGILKQFKAAVNDPDERALDNVMSFYG